MIGFDPQLVFVQGSTAQNLDTNSKSMTFATFDVSLDLHDGGQTTDQIQLLIPGGFQVGAHDDVNGTDSKGNPERYHFVAWGEGVTAIEMTSLTATQSGGGNLIEWQTGYEAANLGFNVYREENGSRVRLNASMLAGSALLAGSSTTLAAGNSYRWWDGAAAADASSAYWIEDIDLNGKHTWHGPVTPNGSDAAGSTSDAQVDVVTLKDLGLAIAPALASGRVATVSETTSEQLSTQQALAAGSAAKISVSEEGWYSVSAAQLVSAGIPADTDPQDLQLYVDGVEQPISVSGGSDGSLDPGDQVEFYGIGQDSPTSGSRAYWLVAGSGSGKRLGSTTRTPLRSRTGSYSSGESAGDGFLFTVTAEPRTIYFPNLKNGDEENFFGPAINDEGVELVLDVHHLEDGSAGTLDVLLQGVTAGAHAVSVSVNGVQVGSVEYSGQAKGSGRFSVPAPALHNGSNLVALVSSGETDASLIQSISLTYTHSFNADGDSLQLTLNGGQTAKISGFDSSDLNVFDVTDPTDMRELLTQIGMDESGYSVTASVGGSGARSLLAVAGSDQPDSVTGNSPSSWSQPQDGANLVIISHSDFLAAAEALADLREGQGLSVAVVDVEDLYDEFSFGSKSPEAIRDFLASAAEQWSTAPSYVLLLGDASIDPKGYLGLGDFDFVPTKMVKTNILETASDDWFVDYDGDGSPDAAIGRLPATSPEGADSLVAKIVAYEQNGSGGWSNEALLVVDRNDASNDFDAAADSAKSVLPSDLFVSELDRDEMDNAALKSSLLSKLNDGQLLVNYIGHGSTEVWNGGILKSADASLLTNGSRAPLVVAMTCLNGYFADLYTESLGEALLRAPDDGAVAVWASSGLTSIAGQLGANKEVLKRLFDGESGTIGDATLKAKKAISDKDVRNTWNLLGDPTTRLR